MRGEHPAEALLHLVAQLRGLDDSHLGAVRGELVGEDVRIDVGHPEALFDGRRAPAEPQGGLGSGGDLDERLLPLGEGGEPREGPLPAPSRADRSKDDLVTSMSDVMRERRKVRVSCWSGSNP